MFMGHGIQDESGFLKFSPRFTDKEARIIANEFYGMKASAKPLPSERDQNFLLEDNGSGERYVLKISNKKEKKEILELQNLAMDRVGTTLGPHFCPQVCPTKDGENITRIDNRERDSHFVRMVTYIHGVPLGEVTTHTPGLLRSVGKLIACISESLKGFSHPAAQRDFYWDLQKGPETVLRFQKYIDDGDKRSLVGYFIERFNVQALSIVAEMERSVVHNDGNDYNILVNHPGPRQNDLFQGRIAGIIDFGDMVYSYTVGDIAVALAYIMLDKKNLAGAVSPVLKGYNEVSPLSERELVAVNHLTNLRLCMSVALSAFQKKQNPNNNYLTISEKKAWKLLQRLRDSNYNIVNSL
jgi:Ser/Thr protein kinase RdoA (MazF antagonist)